jgi:hypothetical protein
MFNLNPWKTFIHLISFEGLFHTPHPKPWLQTQEMRRPALSQQSNYEVPLKKTHPAR